MKKLQHNDITKSIAYKATAKQKALVKEIIESGGKESKSQMMIKAGYSEISAKNPQKVFNSNQFRELLNYMIDDTVLLNKVNEIAIGEDKRSALNAIEMLFKLKDRFPAGKLKLNDYSDEIGDLIEETPLEA